MNRVQKNDQPLPAFELKGSALTLMVLHILDPNAERLAAQMQKQFGQAPGFFRNAPLLIDGNALNGSAVDLDIAALTRQLRELGLVPVALRGGDRELQNAALSAGLGLLPPPRSEQAEASIPIQTATHCEPITETIAPEEVEAVPAAPESSATGEEAALPTPAPGAKIVSRTIRSGQRVVAADGDLIIFGTVNVGAEILARGNIHIYGSLRGRALAGIRGDTTARICALQFQPELVAVAGDYLLQDEIDPALIGSAVVVSISDDKLHTETIGTFVANGI